MLGLAEACVEHGNEMADPVLFDGNVWAVNPAQPAAEAAAVKGNRVLAAGSNPRIKKFIRSRTEKMDLDGNFSKFLQIESAGDGCRRTWPGKKSFLKGKLL